MSANAQETPAEKARRDFLLKDYELKITFLTNQYGRMWTRFNYFVVIETAIIGGKILFGGDTNPYILAGLGACVSFIWYIVGAQDRFLVRVYKTQVAKASEKVANTIWPTENKKEPYWFVGDIDDTVKDTNLCAKRNPKEKYNLKNEFSGWRSKRFSITKLAALIPLVVFIAWLLIIIGLVLDTMGWVQLPDVSIAKCV